MSEEISDLPFRAEYSKSNRAACKMCKEKIDKGVLRLAVMVKVNIFKIYFFVWKFCQFTKKIGKLKKNREKFYIFQLNQGIGEFWIYLWNYI